MTDNELKQAVGRVLVPQYEEMIPEHDEHDFSPEFEAEMKELISGKKPKTANTESSEKSRSQVRISRRLGLVFAAVIALVIGVSAVVLLLKDKGVETDSSQTPKIAVQSSRQDSSSDESEKEKQRQLTKIRDIASELSQSPEKFYVRCYLGSQEDVYFHRQESMSPEKASAAAKRIGEYLKKTDISCLGSLKLKASDETADVQQGYRTELYDKTVSYDIQQLFMEFDHRYFAGIYLCEAKTASFSEIRYTVKDGKGYLRAETSSGGGNVEFLYYGLSGEDLPLYSNGALVLDEWETDNTESRRKAGEKLPDASQTYTVSNCDGSAGFSYSVNNSGIMPSVNISDIKLPKNETVKNAVLEIYLCKKHDGSNALINAAVLSAGLKEGSYDLTQYRDIISKDDIDGIRIDIHFDTDKHPAPDKNDRSGLKNSYNITATLEKS